MIDAIILITAIIFAFSCLFPPSTPYNSMDDEWWW